MNRILKYAWYQLIVIIIVTLFTAAVVGMMVTWWRGKEVSAFIPLGLFALGGLIPVLIIGNSSIHVMYYGWLVLFNAILIRAIWSISAIMQYRCGNVDDKAFHGGLA